MYSSGTETLSVRLRTQKGKERGKNRQNSCHWRPLSGKLRGKEMGKGRRRTSRHGLRGVVVDFSFPHPVRPLPLCWLATKPFLYVQLLYNRVYNKDLDTYLHSEDTWFTCLIVIVRYRITILRKTNSSFLRWFEFRTKFVNPHGSN